MLSIIIPTLNEEKIIEKTLAQFKRLKGIPYELILSDGNSTDATIEIAKKYGVKLVQHDGKSRQTIAAGRNAGAAIAKGTYLVFLDADVTIPNITEFFTAAVESFEENKKIVGLTVFLKVLPEHVTLADKLFFNVINAIYFVSNNFFHVGAASGEFQMVRAEAFRLIGGYNEQLVVAEDNEFFSRLSKVGRTTIATDLHVMHTSRRAHKIGWPRLLWQWTINAAYVKIAKRSFSKQWRVIR